MVSELSRTKFSERSRTTVSERSRTKFSERSRTMVSERSRTTGAALRLRSGTECSIPIRLRLRSAEL